MKTTSQALQEQKDYIIKQLFELIYEHETQECCTDYDRATEIQAEAADGESGFNAAYDVGRYEALKQVLRMVQKI